MAEHCRLTPLCYVRVRGRSAILNFPLKRVQGTIINLKVLVFSGSSFNCKLYTKLNIVLLKCELYSYG